MRTKRWIALKYAQNTLPSATRTQSSTPHLCVCVCVLEPRDSLPCDQLHVPVVFSDVQGDPCHTNLNIAIKIQNLQFRVFKYGLYKRQRKTMTDQRQYMDRSRQAKETRDAGYAQCIITKRRRKKKCIETL